MSDRPIPQKAPYVLDLEPGTYGVALLARAHNVPFYIAAPTSTFDPATPDGDAIPIEQRDSSEVTGRQGRQTAPAEAAVYNPAFDVTPADRIAGIVTERGVICPVNEEQTSRMLRAETCE